MSDVQCHRCGNTRQGLTAAPMPGTWGERILNESCEPCWHEWQEEQIRLINHENLRPFVPADKIILYKRMREFLKLSGEAPKSSF